MWMFRPAFWKLSLICKHFCGWEKKAFLSKSQDKQASAASGVTCVVPHVMGKVGKPLRCWMSIPRVHTSRFDLSLPLVAVLPVALWLWAVLSAGQGRG